MSLVAAIPCAGGIILFADSQETMSSDGARVERLKIDSHASHRSFLGFTAAGNTVEIIDALSADLASWWRASTASEPSTITAELSERLGAFYTRDSVVYHPRSPDDKLIYGLVGVMNANMRQPVAFRIRSTIVHPVMSPVMDGTDHTAVLPSFERLESSQLTPNDAIAAGLYAFYRVKRRSFYVGFDTDYLLMTRDGFHPSDRLITRVKETYISLMADEVGEGLLMDALQVHAPHDDVARKLGAKWSDKVRKLRDRLRYDEAVTLNRYFEDHGIDVRVDPGPAV